MEAAPCGMTGTKRDSTLWPISEIRSCPWTEDIWEEAHSWLLCVVQTVDITLLHSEARKSFPEHIQEHAATMLCVLSQD